MTAPRAHLDEPSERAVTQEVERLANDVEDTRERRSVLADMDALGTDWPE